MNKKFFLLNKYLIVIIGIISLICTTGLLDNKFNITIFRMFTTISNIMVVIYFIIDLFYLKKYKKTFCPVIKQMVTLNITITFLIVVFILRMGFNFNSFFSAAFLGLHFLVPILTIIDAIIFDKKGLIKAYYPFIWIIPVFIYISVCLIFKVYPYPFINVNKLGLQKVLLTCFILAIIFLLLSYIYYFIDKKLKK